MSTPKRNSPNRREFLIGACALPLLPAVRTLAALVPQSSKFRYVRPGDPFWPSQVEWTELNSRVQGLLIVPTSPLQVCIKDPGSDACKIALEDVKNPFFNEDQAGGTQSTGWLGAWEAKPSSYAVAASTAEDVAEAVRFARKNKIRLVVKGTGHDYLGRSNAPDSLLIWTHNMRKTTFIEEFVPTSAPAGTKGIPALQVQAGTRWLEAYTEATIKHGMYVQGGGCTSVGACGGFVQGGGFGSFSKKFGTGAAGLSEAEVVTADGQIRIANEYQNADLFWALRGGGGCTYGVVTRMTLMAHPLPDQIVVVQGKITAESDEAFQELIERMLQLYDEELNNEHCGEQFQFNRDNTVSLSLLFMDLSRADVEAKFKAFDVPGKYKAETTVLGFPLKALWNPTITGMMKPPVIELDKRLGQPPNQFWWASNSGEVSAYWYAYQSRWVPASLCRPNARKGFAKVLFEASRHWSVSFHINKGLAGMSAEALARCKKTSVNPVAYEAAALVILGSCVQDVYPGVPGHEPNSAEAKECAAKVSAAMKLIREATPGTGAYANEADYFEKDWQRSFWGVNYARLLEIKKKYDPDSVFHTHHSVGSEGWSADGMDRNL